MLARLLTIPAPVLVAITAGSLTFAIWTASHPPEEVACPPTVVLHRVR